MNQDDNQQAGRGRPPSFTPQGRSARPNAGGDAIAVGGAHPRPMTQDDERSSAPDVPMRPEPRIKRQSSRSGPVATSRGGTPPPAPPQGRGVQPRTAVRVPAAPGQSAQGSARPVQIPPQRGAQPGGGRSAQPGSARGAQPVHGPATRQGAPVRTAPGAGSRPPGRPTPGSSTSGAGSAPRKIRIRKGRLVAVITVFVLVLLLAWPVGLLIWANGKIQHVDALSEAASTPGTTYLLAGSDARGEGISEDGTTGARTDSIMLLHSPVSGPAALISIPRDTYAEVPGQGPAKLNAAYAWGGPQLLVETVEQLTGMKVDHYVEVGFGGIEGIVDAIGGVELCLDYDVNDPKSELVWTAGCHVSDGHTALAFSRMRYSDPKGDIGRAERQRQVIAAISKKAANPSLVFKPGSQVSLIDSGLGALTVDDKTGIIDLGRLALAFRAANGPGGITGTPPISDPDFRPGGVGSTVQLDPDLTPQFWIDIRDGKLPAGPVGGLPQ